MTLHATVYLTVGLHIAKIEDCMLVVRYLTFLVYDVRQHVFYVWFFVLATLTMQHVFLIHIILTLIIYFLKGWMIILHENQG